MDRDYPPLPLLAPQVAKRRRASLRLPPLPDDVISHRREIAESLLEQIRPLSESLASMSDEERRAVFYKLQHDHRPDLTGTDLKPVVQSEHVSLAVPKAQHLRKLEAKVRDFGDAEGARGRRLPNEQLVTRLQSISEGDPRDRLCQAFYDNYDAVVAQEWVICEIEMVSLETGPRQRREQLKRTQEDLRREFAHGTYGNFFDHEELGDTCRAVIRCSGSLLRRLVEAPEWRRRIWWFDERPKFQTLTSELAKFSMDSIDPVQGPPESASTVCIVDSGVTVGNPFLRPVSRDALVLAFPRDVGTSPYDEYGHGSAVASLAAYYALKISPGASNRGQVWIASARVLDASGELSDDEPRLLSNILSEVVNTFAPLGVRVYNLSFSVRNRRWDEEMRRTVPRTSWVARTLDRLSRERDIVFVACTGNLAIQQIRDTISNGRAYPDYLCDSEASILDPGQAALALTVGSLSHSTRTVDPSGFLSAIAQAGAPSPFTRSGPGMLGEIKPELVEYGGNLVHDAGFGTVRYNQGTSIVVASNRLSPPIDTDVGTSLAAPRVSHHLAMIMSDLESLGVSHASASLLRAFLVNSASLEPLGTIDVQVMFWTKRPEAVVEPTA